MSEKLSNAIARSIDEQGYQKRPDGVFALCNIHPSGLTTVDVVCAMYNHVTKGSLKSVEEIASELTKTELSYRKSLMVQNSGEVLNHISSIGDVIFDCNVYPHKINITEFVNALCLPSKLLNFFCFAESLLERLEISSRRFLPPLY